MELYTDTIIDLEGNVVSGADILVLKEDKTIADIFDSAGNAISSLKSGSRGDFSFQAINGKYFVQVSIDGNVKALNGPITLFDPSSLSFDTGVVNVKDKQFFGGANGDGVTDDTRSIQAAFNFVGVGGSVLFPTSNGEKYLISDEIRITKPCTVSGSSTGNIYGAYSSSSFPSFSGVIQSNPSKSAFKLVAAKENYAFDQFGILGIKFHDLMISGPSNSSRALSGITTDTTINGGNYHIRHCSFTNVSIRYFNYAIDFTGIAYLNSFFTCLSYNCGTGWRIARGQGGDNGGQTRWFSCVGVANDTCVSLNEDGSAGSFALFGCTMSESKYGIRAHEECVLTVSGCEFEGLQNAGNGAGIYIEIKESIPGTGSPKTIIGNKFLSSDADIWINKTTASSESSDFAWPMIIDGNALMSVVGLKVTVPAGHGPMNSQKFVFGSSNDGNTSFNFKGRDMRQSGLVVKRQEYMPFSPGTAFVLPIGAILRKVRLWLTANNVVFTGLKLGNQSNDGKYAFISADNQALNTPVEYISSIGDKIDGSNNFINVAFTAGINGAAGVVEVEYFVS